MAQVKAEWDRAVEMVGKEGFQLDVMAPAHELEKLKKDMGPHSTKFFVLQHGRGFRSKKNLALVSSSFHKAGNNLVIAMLPFEKMTR